MLKYKAIDGQVFEAETARQVVRQMRGGSFQPTESKEDYMDQASLRARIQNGSTISAEDAERFLADLCDAGLLEEIQ